VVKRRRFTAGIVLASVGSIAMAADLKPSTLKDGRVVITISGEISPGDSDALKAAIKTANDAGKLAASIRLNSEGGNLLEGVRLAEVVNLQRWQRMSDKARHARRLAF
jgi:membrane-bound ClpP family serine protease